MSRKLFVWREGRGVVPLEEATARESFHAVHGDEMAPTWHPADSKVYTSASEFRKTTMRNGYTEVGNELLSNQKPEKRPEKPVSYEAKKFLWDQVDRAYHSKK